MHYLFNIAGPGPPGIRDDSISEHMGQAFYQVAANIQGRKGYHVATHNTFYFHQHSGILRILSYLQALS